MQCGLCEAQQENYRIIEENEDTFSIIPTSPLKLGHIMILPKRHVEKISELSGKELKNFFQLVEKLKEAVKRSSNQDPIFHINTGKHKSQEHFHLHIVPTKSNLRKLIADQEDVPERQAQPKEKMEEMKNIILKNIGS
ncbi:MAG: HIT family protein [Nanoarchaeota archaeon]